MVDQAEVTSRLRETDNSVPRSAARSMADILHDAVSLAELQGRLLSVDLQRAVTAISIPLAVLCAGVALAVCCLPIGLVSIALLLESATNLSRVAAFWITFLGGLIVSLSMAGGAIGWLRSGPGFFESSKSEWTANLNCLKSALRRSSRPTVRSGPDWDNPPFHGSHEAHANRQRSRETF